MKSNSTRQNFHLGAWELCEDVSLQGEDAQNEGLVAQQEPERMLLPCPPYEWLF